MSSRIPPWEKLYSAGGFTLFSQKEYVTLVVDFLERLDPEIVVQRLTGETYRAITVAPEWSVNKIGVHNAIHKELEERDSWQGKHQPKDSTQTSGLVSLQGIEGARL